MDKNECFPSEISKYIYEKKNKKLILNIEENNGEIKIKEVNILYQETYESK